MATNESSPNTPISNPLLSGPQARAISGQASAATVASGTAEQQPGLAEVEHHDVDRDTTYVKVPRAVLLDDGNPKNDADTMRVKLDWSELHDFGNFEISNDAPTKGRKKVPGYHFVGRKNTRYVTFEPLIEVSAQKWKATKESKEMGVMELLGTIEQRIVKVIETAWVKEHGMRVDRNYGYDVSHRYTCLVEPYTDYVPKKSAPLLESVLGRDKKGKFAKRGSAANAADSREEKLKAIDIRLKAFRVARSAQGNAIASLLDLRAAVARGEEVDIPTSWYNVDGNGQSISAAEAHILFEDLYTTEAKMRRDLYAQSMAIDVAREALFEYIAAVGVILERIDKAMIKQHELRPTIWMATTLNPGIQAAVVTHEYLPSLDNSMPPMPASPYARSYLGGAVSDLDGDEGDDDMDVAE